MSSIAEEVLTLLREIHAAVCTEKKPLKAAKEKKAPVDRSTTLTARMQKLMSDGAMRSSYEMWLLLGGKDKEDSVMSTASYLAKRGKLVRLRQNVYQIANAKVEAAHV